MFMALLGAAAAALHKHLEITDLMRREALNYISSQRNMCTHHKKAVKFCIAVDVEHK